ncbi:hypothetical protein Golob_025180 [Gossypium lobatum]|uniref:Uncharacterized protein n=1 Tax=Gossypium lobatum TaxID=34289 RepID=A0A7J8NF62_9ROSI|nr:hypothetical protein [Gossypium lobatum]
MIKLFTLLKSIAITYFDVALQQYRVGWTGREETYRSVDGVQRQPTRNMRVTIYFDATFDRHSSRVVSRLVVQDLGGKILASKMVIHSAISFPFAAEAHARSANEYAHIRAHEALKMGEGKYLVGAVPNYIRHEMENRRPMHPD